MPPRKKKQSESVSIAQFKELPENLQEFQVSDDFRRNAAQLRSDLVTPERYIKSRPDGFDYVDEAYMRTQLDKHFPNWSWESTGNNPTQFLGSEWVIVTGTLVVLDHGVPRKFFSPGGARIQFKRNQPHTSENVIDIDKNLASANTNAFKRCVNRLCRIADDVYKKQDTELTKEQLDKIHLLINDHDAPDGLRRQINILLQRGDINRVNFDLQFKQLENELENKMKKERSVN
jgi:hypothetical protein